MKLTGTSDPNNGGMTESLVAARAMIILWTNLAVLPAAIAFDAIEAELERRGHRVKSSR
jgi:hypothetical protein